MLKRLADALLPEGWVHRKLGDLGYGLLIYMGYPFIIGTTLRWLYCSLTGCSL